MIEAPEHLAEKVRGQILRDLQPSLRAVYAKSGLAVLIGGPASLLICGQFGVGMTHAAKHFHRELHDHANDLMCAITCGIVFAVMPAIILRLLCSPIQFRVVLKKWPHVALVWFAGLGTLLAHHGQTGVEVTNFVAWCSATFVTFWLLTRAIDRFAGPATAAHPTEAARIPNSRF